MTTRRVFTLYAVAVTTVVGCIIFTTAAYNGEAEAQTSRARSGRKPNIKLVEVRAAKAQDAFIREAAELARDYEDLKELEKAKEMLEVILKLRPDTPGVKKKIDEFNETLLSANEFEIEFDASQGWTPTNTQVAKGEKFRAQAVGDYRMLSNATVGPDGFPTGDGTKNDMAGGVPCGALMGLIAERGKKTGRPFTIGAGREIEPRETGMLFVRINALPGSKCTGKIRIQLSGNIRSARQP